MTDNGLAQWITTRQARELCGYSEAGLRKLRRAGKIRGKVLGRTALYHRDDIVRLAEGGRGRTRPPDQGG